ncbi:MAG: DUF4313 domain-containing protein [Clostridiales bacterium]|nr:DUF4313 domain-containing protein [Clostridiales bacterium]
MLTYKLRNFYGGDYTIAPLKTNYARDNSLAIVLYDVKNKETFEVISTNLVFSIELNEDEAFIDTSKEWAIRFIEENKLAKKIQRMAISGFCKYQAYKFDLDKINPQEAPYRANNR